MSNKNRIRSVLLVVGLIFAMMSINFVSAHEGHKHRHAPAIAKKLKNPLQSNEETIAAGRGLFDKNCSSCHGGDGKAKTEVAAAMKTKPTDLTAKEMKGITDGEIYWVVTNGIARSGMPAFKTRMKPNERWQTTLYVKHLMGDHPHAAHSGH